MRPSIVRGRMCLLAHQETTSGDNMLALNLSFLSLILLSSSAFRLKTSKLRFRFWSTDLVAKNY